MWLFTDTETTGLFKDNELLSVSVTDIDGNMVYHKFVRPEHHTEWADAQAVNGISPEDVSDCPTYAEILPELIELFAGNQVVAYNMNFDRYFLRDALVKADKLFCAMKSYTNLRKIPHPTKPGNLKWFKLCEAVSEIDPDFSYDAHDSLEDCKAGCVVWRHILETAPEVAYEMP